jgi:hypothetical protein
VGAFRGATGAAGIVHVRATLERSDLSGIAREAVCGGEAGKVGNRLDIPYDNVRHAPLLAQQYARRGASRVGRIRCQSANLRHK